MNRIKLGIRNILIIAMAGAALFIASAPALCSDFYNAKPEDVPDWAKQGNFQFIRIDGGTIESLKAERTWWGKEFSDDEKDVLSNIYGKYWDKMLARIKEAGFDWIWVTWSNGWSMKDEKENRKQLKKLIDSCHENGIHVTAYLSASNIFWESTFRDEPESVTWLLINGGKPVNYGGPDNPMRFIADIMNPDWRAYLVKKAKLAIEAGVDAVMFDNILGDMRGHEMLLSQVQSMAAKTARKENRPKVIVYANTHEDPDRISINDRCELLWNEYGKSSPGVWDDDGWYVNNARKTKFIAAEKFTWQPQKYENDKYHCGPREKCYPDAAGQKLSIAEAWGFGSSLSRNIEGKFLRDLIRDEPTALDAWAAITQYNMFINAHRDLYTDMAPVARIAVLSRENADFGDVDADLAGEFLIKGNVMFDYKIATRFHAGQPLEAHKLLLVPGSLKQLSADEENALADFAASGGKIAVLTKGPAAAGTVKDKFYLADRIKNVEIIEIDDSAMREIQKGGAPARVLDAIQKLAGGPVKLENGKYAVANVMKKTGGSMFAVHLMNYDLNNPETNVKVKLDLGDYFKPGDTCKIKLLSPDSGQETPISAPCKGGKTEFTVPLIEHYSIVVVTP